MISRIGKEIGEKSSLLFVIGPMFDDGGELPSLIESGGHTEISGPKLFTDDREGKHVRPATSPFLGQGKGSQPKIRTDFDDIGGYAVRRIGFLIEFSRNGPNVLGHIISSQLLKSLLFICQGKIQRIPSPKKR
jgi:hypothetical protein